MYQDLVWTILAGGLLGMLGQGVRAVAGIRKPNDAANALGKTFGDLFSASRLLLSLFIGFTAGALAVLLSGLDAKLQARDTSAFIAIIAAGYAGTHFIDAFLSKMPGGASQSKASAPAPKPSAMG